MNRHVAYFAAGCFWSVEEAFRSLSGVLKTKVGYMGGTTKNPTYEDVCSDQTGHAEVVKVVFDPKTISYTELLNTFWDIHDPTQLNRQGYDVGDQYRSEIFFTTTEQAQIALESRSFLSKSKKYTQPIVTAITAAPIFYPAEEYHQMYLVKRGLASCKI